MHGSIYIKIADVRQKQNALHLGLEKKNDIYGYMWGALQSSQS